MPKQRKVPKEKKTGVPKKYLSGAKNRRAKAAEIIADLTLNPIVDAAFGQAVADSASEYNKKLATALATSVVTGKPHRIILSPKAKKRFNKQY